MAENYFAASQQNNLYFEISLLANQTLLKYVG